MKRPFVRGLLAAVVLFGFPSASASQVRSGEPATTALERFAGEIAYFGPNDFVLGFRSEQQPARAFARHLEQGGRTANDFLPLLRHRNPKVRTLALVGLYSLDDPKLLPAIFTLVKDDGATFPTLLPTASMFSNLDTVRPDAIKPQTVSDIARAILNVYLERGGYRYGPLGPEEFREPGFDEYWRARSDRTSAAGWWSVRLSRASHATSPTPADRIEAIRQLRGQIDALAEPDRTFILLWLQSELGADALASPDELILLARRLGPDTLMQLLQRNIPSGDPDLQPRPHNNHAYAQMCLFILRNAAVLLRPSDATALLDQEAWERDHQKHGISDPLISPWWAMAAAQLNAQDARPILFAAHARFQAQYDGNFRLDLAEALWRLAGESETARVIDWVYQELSHPPLHTWAISGALDNLLKTPGRDSRVLLAALAGDPRFDDLNWRSVEVLARNTGAIPEDELKAVWSPGGIDFFMKDAPEAMKQYPRETSGMVETLARWRRAVKDGIER